MPGNDDLFKAMGMLQQGIQQYSISQAAKDAQQQLNDINANVTNEQERLAHANAVGQQLALRLQASGAPADQIQATAGRLTVSAGEERQAQLAQQQQQTSLGQQEKMFGKEAALKKELEQMKLDFMAKQMGMKTSKMVDGYGKELDKVPGFKDIVTNIPKLDDALDKIRSTKGAMGATAAINLAQLGLIRGAAGRVNEKEIEGANESQSKRAQLWKRMGLEASGEVPLNIQAFWEKFIQRAKDNAQIHAKDQVRSFAQSKKGMVGDDGVSTLEESLLQRYNLGSPSQSANRTQTAPQTPAAPANPINKYIK